MALTRGDKNLAFNGVIGFVAGIVAGGFSLSLLMEGHGIASIAVFIVAGAIAFFFASAGWDDYTNPPTDSEDRFVDAAGLVGCGVGAGISLALIAAIGLFAASA